MKRKLILICILLLVSFSVSAMHIFVIISGNTIILDVEPDLTIEEVKIKIQDKQEIPPEQQTLIFEGKVLENHKTLSDYDIQMEATVRVIVSDPLGIKNLETNNNPLNLYPNPSSGFLQIAGLNATENYKIYNILGTEVKSGNLRNKGKIDIRDFTDGLYFLKLDHGNSIKFIKE